MFEKLLIRVTKELDKNSIPYMIIGGQAVLLYGEPRLTKDIDITLGVSVNKLNELLSIIKKIELLPLPENIKKFAEKTFVLPVKDAKTNIRVDFIFSQTSYEKQAIKRANIVNLKNAILKFASIEDLIIHKIFAGRPRDLEDVKSIIIKNPSFNKNYIKKWLEEFDSSMGQKKLIDIFKNIIKK
jgi:predicted nucleotidyltransferase